MRRLVLCPNFSYFYGTLFLLSVQQSDEDQGVQQSDEDQIMEISNGDETGSDITPDSDKSSARSSDMNGEDEDNSSEEIKAPRLFKFTAVNSYGSAELDNKFKDDGKPLRLNGNGLSCYTVKKHSFGTDRSGQIV